jgi:hypothetical protein
VVSVTATGKILVAENGKEINKLQVAWSPSAVAISPAADLIAVGSEVLLYTCNTAQPSNNY